MRGLFLVSSGMVALILVGLVAAQTGTPPLGDNKLAAAHARFGFRLLSELSRSDPAGNVFISAPSVALALSMTWNGASGATRDAISRALNISGMDVEALNRESLSLKTALE